ncbi:sensor domain-containing diguanylate cyclase [Glaciihabitans sp. dw_435]|uniref:bifunctional diguanylate cyclase/phosphodiesterase n=1 Tax=Glaciihabitans sp. dw_435 TaxID=2720081 RepID=UPI001BD50263|nr:sensor domain-containing diguanylate cyclase [Glaciihabitans sp. dw_435]
MSANASILRTTEQQRLDNCAQEPIRTPGSVQPHGALLAIDADNTIVIASDNTGSVLGTPAADLLSTNVVDLIGSDVAALVARFFVDRDATTNPISAVVANTRFDLIVHRSGELVVLEFEPATTELGYQSAPGIYSAIRRLAQETTVAGLWAAVARELRELTHFDQVMVYHFYPDGHGEVVAEQIVEGMNPYLGLHFPASDIPTQARELYLTKLSRLIASTSHDGAALITTAEAPVTTFDLSYAELRSVSPVHLQFMRNMGQGSTLSLSLVHDGTLIGMITCAHRTPHRVPFVLRQGLEILASQVGLQLHSMREIDRLTREMELRTLRLRLIGQLAGNHSIAEALIGGELTLLDLIPAAGAAVRLSGTVTSVGDTAPDHHITAFADAVRDKFGLLSIVTDSLAVDHPELAALLPAVAGVLMVPLGADGDFLAWFRPEISQTIQWLGDQRPANRETPLSPRNSFSSWTQSVSGVSDPWAGLETEAAELCRDLDGARLRLAESRLASMALYDDLTGLPNRRLLMDRLEHAFTKHARGDSLAMLFIDLDGFKAVNDTLGHDAGDALLVHVGAQLLATTRAEDTVSRIGGDEFVVLCENTSDEEADLIAARIVEAVCLPVVIGDRSVSSTASVGVSAAEPGINALELLRKADAAMYRAKSQGRNRVSR